MKLREILRPDALLENITSPDKRGALREFADLAAKIHPQLKSDDLLQVLLNREKLGSTGIGNGIAIPHGKVPMLGEIIALFGRSQKGIDFQSHDQKPAHLFFVLLAPESAIGNHLQALARLSRLLKSNDFREHLLSVPADKLHETLLSEDDKI